ncbi:MAG: diguanylate cyclase [Deltaproteobacteria bacterium]|nr:diguanylate cyclase [Deltaproteobacteria bacterium]
MMNATALVLGSNRNKKLQLVKYLAATQLFDRVKPLPSTTSLFQHLKTKSADIICWLIDTGESETDWINKLRDDDKWHDIPLVAFVDDQQSLINGFNLGASDSLKQSTDPHELNARLHEHLKRWQRLLDLRQSKEQLQKMALTDALTGIGNRATFDMSIKQATARTQRSGAPVSLLMIDLDHFKWFNDNHGHQAGDSILKHVAQAIRESARDADICCRYGGEEFAVILPDTTADHARILAERIHQQVALASRQLRQTRMPITVSIGISCSDLDDVPHPARLIKEADNALYQAKENGRNRTETWQPASFQHGRTDYSYSSTHHLAFGT